MASGRATWGELLTEEHALAAACWYAWMNAWPTTTPSCTTICATLPISDMASTKRERERGREGLACCPVGRKSSTKPPHHQKLNVQRQGKGFP